MHATRKQLSEVGADLAGDAKEKIEAALKELETASRGEDKDEIEAKSQALMEASGALMEAVQKKAEQASSGAEPAAASGSKDDNVVDAEFEEVKDDKK